MNRLIHYLGFYNDAQIQVYISKSNDPNKLKKSTALNAIYPIVERIIANKNDKRGSLVKELAKIPIDAIVVERRNNPKYDPNTTPISRFHCGAPRYPIK